MHSGRNGICSRAYGSSSANPKWHKGLPPPPELSLSLFLPQSADAPGASEPHPALTRLDCQPVRICIFGAAQVTVNALENSVSVASLVLTTEALVTEIPKSMSKAAAQEAWDKQGGLGGTDDYQFD